MHHLTALRGISAFLVVLYHIKTHLEPYLAGWIFVLVEKSYLAVDFFFVLSGFIISYNYEGRLAGFDKNQVFVFIVKRIARIYPLHFFVMLAYLVIPFAHILTGRAFDGEVRYSFDRLIYNVFLIQNWGFVDGGGWNVPSWSVSTEFLAYLTFPVAAAVLARKSIYIKGLFVLSLYFVMVVMFAVNDALNIGQYISTLGVVRCLAGFYFGYFVCSVYRGNLPASSARIFSFGLLLCIIVVAQYYPRVGNYFYVNLCLGAVVYVLITNRQNYNKILEMPLFVYLGRISYSLYMVHYFIRDVMGMVFLSAGERAGGYWIVAYLCLTLVVSHFSYRFVEVKLRQMIVNSRFCASRSLRSASSS